MAAQRRQTSSTAVAPAPDTRPGKIQAPFKSAQEWKGYFEKAEKQVRAAFPKMVKFDRVVSTVVTCMHRNPKLFQSTPLSVMGAMIQGAQLGLDFDPNLGEAYMVPYSNSKKTDTGWIKVNEAQLQIGYQGLMKLARNSGTIGDIRSQCVYDNDVFDYEEGTTQHVRHVPWAMAVRKKLTDATEKGNLWAVYAVAQTKDGEQTVKVMFLDEIEAIRKRSRAANDGPWVTDYEAMAKKTVIRQLCKLLPRSIELSTAVTLDELNDANLPQGLDLIPFVEADPDAAAELQTLREEGEKEAAKAQQEPDAPAPNITEELLSKIQEKADALIAMNGDCEAFDDIVTKVAKATKQKSHSVQEFTEDGLVALLAALEDAA